MSIFASPEEHAANPPSTWEVRQWGRKWVLVCTKWPITTLATFTTMREAKQAKITGFLADLYAKESRWYAGESVDNWKPYIPQAKDSAPEMLAALRETQNYFDALYSMRPHVNHGTEGKRIREVVQDAIATAKGG